MNESKMFEINGGAIEQIQKVGDHINTLPISRKQKEKLALMMSGALATAHRDALLQGLKIASKACGMEAEA